MVLPPAKRTRSLHFSWAARTVDVQRCHRVQPPVRDGAANAGLCLCRMHTQLSVVQGMRATDKDARDAAETQAAAQGAGPQGVRLLRSTACIILGLCRVDGGRGSLGAPAGLRALRTRCGPPLLAGPGAAGSIRGSGPLACSWLGAAGSWRGRYGGGRLWAPVGGWGACATGWPWLTSGSTCARGPPRTERNGVATCFSGERFLLFPYLFSCVPR